MSQPMLIETSLEEMERMQASDLFIRADAPPTFRVFGEIRRSELPAPTEDDIRAFMTNVLTPVAFEQFAQSPDIDVACSIKSAGRFRINFFMHQGRLGMAARLIPSGAVEFDTLGLPQSIRDMADAPSGLILVVGPTGCGKSTTLAALIHHINSTRKAHIVTIEDPIEFVHEEIQSLIHQRQVGSDTVSYSTALRHVVRQNPDVILIGEMRDADAVQTALSAALTGHLVLTTLHTSNVVQSVDRMLNYFEPEARAQAQVDLAMTLVGVASMRLLPRLDKAGRCAAVEVLLATPLVRKLISDWNLAELYDLMKRSNDAGMCTLNQSLVSLCREGLISPPIAMHATVNPDELRLNLQGMYTGIDSIDMRTSNKKTQDDE